VYFYLKYVLEQMPHYMEGTDFDFLERMMPWSLEYKEYERNHTAGLRAVPSPGICGSKPRTPKKKCGPVSNKEGAA